MAADIQEEVAGTDAQRNGQTENIATLRVGLVPPLFFLEGSMRIIHANIQPMRGEAIADGFIEFNERIIALGRFSGKAAPGDIDARGATLLPGFIDAHTHLGMCEDALGFEGDDVNEMTNPCTPNLRAVDAVNVFDRCFREALEAGVTAVATGPGSANPIAGQIAVIGTSGTRIDDMVIKAPCAMKFALGENPKTVYNEKKQAPSTRMATAAIIRENLEKAREYAAGRKKKKDVPFDAKSEALTLLLDGTIGAHIHAHRTDDIFTAARIAAEFSIRYSIVHCTQGHLIAEELGRIGLSAMSGPLLCDRSKPELKDATPATPGCLSKAGVLTAIVTDHPVVPIQYLALSAGLAAREGMDRAEALKAITINPAIILGVDSEIGSLEPGKRADMVLFEGDPLALEAKPLAVFILGKAVVNHLS